MNEPSRPTVTAAPPTAGAAAPATIERRRPAAARAAREGARWATRRSLGSTLRLRLFGIAPEETTFRRRGFRGATLAAREHLEQVGPAFAAGYHAALVEGGGGALVNRLLATDLAWRGFAFEGAAMGLALLDRLLPWRRDRWQRFLAGPGAPHAYMVYVGAGWALARLPGRVPRALNQFDPLLRWLVVDGYGFHEGFFHWRRYLDGAPVPPQFAGYARRAFDQGFGRSLWFVNGANPALVAETLAGFPEARRADLWSGIGLACAYAGGAHDPAALRALRHAAGSWWSALGQGAAFAAKARCRAGNLVDHTEAACEVLCGTWAEEAAQLTDASLENLPRDGAEPAYEVWRRRIQARIAELLPAT